MSLRKDALSWAFIGFILLLVGAAALYVLWPQLRPHVNLKLGDGIYNTQVARTQEDLSKGLSGTSGLRQDQALLLAYTSDAKWPIWMKDMNYPIDVVWLNKDKKVVYIVKNIAPDSYPVKFEPKADARYIVELPSGAVDQKSIAIDTMALFDENHLEGWGQ